MRSLYYFPAQAQLRWSSSPFHLSSLCSIVLQGSSPTPIFQTVAALAKGTERLAHENTLLAAEVRTLHEALSKRRRAKKARIRQGGALTVRMHKTFWRRRTWMSRFDAICVWRGVIGTRGNCLNGVVERLVTMRELVKNMKICLVR
jgi:hypothetical protein